MVCVGDGRVVYGDVPGHPLAPLLAAVAALAAVTTDTTVADVLDILSTVTRDLHEVAPNQIGYATSELK